LGNKITIIGAGHIGRELASQFVKHKSAKPSDITVTRKDENGLAEIRKELKINTSTDNQKAVKGSDVVILAVRPQDMKGIAEELKNVIQKNQIIVSVAAGLGLGFFEKYFPKNQIFRVMPNPFLASGLGIMAYAKNKNVDSSGIKLIRHLFGRLSEEFMEIRDEDMHLFTTFAASGAAVFYYIFDAFQKTALKNKLKGKNARKLVLLSAKAAAIHCMKSDKGFSDIVDSVCTPKGMTVEGIKFLKSKKVGELIERALQKIAGRSMEIGKNLIK
jgi:pyrroline-5-carboxylate reductase